MNNLTKARILALFLGTAQATDLTALAIINAPSVVYNALSTEAKKSAYTRVASSGTKCSANKTCVDANKDELCASIQIAGEKKAPTEGICVNKQNCNNLGILNSKDFSVQCWADPKTKDAANVAPVMVDPSALLASVKGWITKKTVSWAVKQLYVSNLFNFQDGWWTETGGKWTEVDKPSNNSCHGNDGCPPLTDGADKGKVRCCMTWPDTNNKQCKLKSLDKTNVTVGPQSFVPTCAVDAKDSKIVHSKDDIKKTAIADASEKVKKFEGNEAAEKKKAAGFDKMTKEAQAAYDKDAKAASDKRALFLAKVKKAAGADVAGCDDDCKLKYEKELYTWVEGVYKLCKADSKQIACVKADDLWLEENTQRGKATKNFYSKMDDAERGAFVKGRKEAITKQEASLTAAWLKEKAPKAGEAGSTCSGSTKCTLKDSCCGTSTPSANASGVTTGEKKDVCAVATTGWSDVIGKKYTHVCATASGAAKLFASAAAAVAAASFM